MKRKSNIFSLSALLMAIIFFASPIKGEKWKAHVGFDNQPVKIIDTERYTYFHVHQKYYAKNTASFQNPYCGILVYDSQSPERGIFSLNELVSLHGASVRATEYSPEGKFLAILYLDGGIDLVYDSGQTLYNEGLKKAGFPGWSEVHSMTLSGKELWISAGKGYAVIDGGSGRTVSIRDLGETVNWIGRSGDRTIALTSSGIYESTEGYPLKFSDFKKISVAGSPANPKVLMPRNDGSFLYLANKVSEGTCSLNIIYPEKEGWKYRHVSDLWLDVVPVNNTITHQYEKNFIRNKKGWCFFTTDDLRQIHINRAATAVDLVDIIPSRMGENPDAVRKLTLGGTWDGTYCFTYLDRGRFSRGENQEGRFLIDDAGSIRPDAPALMQASHVAHVPGHGVATVNYGYSWAFPILGNTLPPLVSVYKDGVWELPNPAYQRPASANEDAALNTLYQNNLGRFPVANPTGLSVDPANPDYVWLGSTYSGIAALNIKDPSRNPLHYGSAADPLSKYPGFKELFPNMTTWNGLAATCGPCFDGDGTLWVAYFNYDGRSTSEPSIRLYYWPKSQREKVLKSGDVSLTEGFNYINLPISEDSNATLKCLATTKPSSSNLIFNFLTGPSRHIARLNHKGTLSDTTDDVVEDIYKVEDENGSEWTFIYCHDIKEDPLTGEIWVADAETLLSFDPTAPIKDGVIKGKTLNVEYEGMKGNPLSYIPSRGITFDSSNRIWVTTEETGVWCISADRKRVEAHYTTANSGLLSDTGHGIAWNPERGSLMISTDGGFMELWPDLAGEGNQQRLSVWPREITPDFSGNILIRGLRPNEPIEILDSSHKTIVKLTADGSGSSFWNLKDSQGQGVADGFYFVHTAEGDVEVAVMR